MGLDMFVWKMKKISKEEAAKLNGLKADEIGDKYSLFNIKDEEEPCIKAVVPYCQKIKAIHSYADLDKIKKDHNIKGRVYLGATHYGKDITYTFYDTEGTKVSDVTLSFEVLEGKYTIQKLEDTYVTHKLKEAYYWRKEYELNDVINDACNYEIENCGYYRLTNKMINAMRRWDREASETLTMIKHNLNEDEGLFYHIWY